MILHDFMIRILWFIFSVFLFISLYNLWMFCWSWVITRWNRTSSIFPLSLNFHDQHWLRCLSLSLSFARSFFVNNTFFYSPLVFLRIRAILQVVLNLAFIITWSLNGILIEFDGRHEYILPEQWWRVLIFVSLNTAVCDT